MVTAFVFVYVYFLCTYFLQMWLVRGVEKRGPPRPLAGIWLEGDDAQCPHLFSLGTPGISLPNATSTIHLFNVG